MNCKQVFMVLFIIAICLGGPTDTFANTNNSPENCEGKSVAACIGQNGEDPPTEQKEIKTSPEPATNTTTFGTMMKVLFALVIVVALMIFILKLLHKRSQIVQQGKGIQTLGGAMLGNQRSVQLVKVGNRVLVVGVGDNVELIKEIDDEQEINTLIESNESRFVSEAKSGMNDWINRLFSNRNENNSDRNSFQNLLRKQLNDAKQDRSKVIESLKKKGQNND